MPFRAKVKKAFGGKARDGGDSPSSSSSSPPQRTDIEYYKPGQVPPSKYRGPWNQKHQDKLHAFSFEDATRDRKEPIPVAYSPMGTRAQSRRSSWVSRARSSLGGSRAETEDGSTARKRSHASHVEQVVESAEDDADIGNVGLSRRVTTEQRNAEQINRLGMEKTFSQGEVKQENAQTFSPEDLSKAMTAATIKSDR